MSRTLPGHTRARQLLYRNYAFTPYKPNLRISPVPARLTASPMQERQLRNAGYLPVGVEAFEREGANYPAPLPQVVQQETNLDDLLADLLAGGQVVLAQNVMAKSTAADRFRFFVQTANPDTFDLLNVGLLIDGQAFIKQQAFTAAFPDGMELFFRRMQSDSTVQVVARLRPGAIPVPPLGTVQAHLFIDAYQGKFIG